MPKEKYRAPEFEVVFFDQEDVIRTSDDTKTEPMSATSITGFSFY